MHGAIGLEEDEKEERKGRGNNNFDEMEGASKKMKRRLKMVQRL